MRIPAYMTFAAILFLCACAQQTPAPSEPPDTRAADEEAIRAAGKDWAAAARAKDADKFVSFYADEAQLLLEQEADTRGKAALREAIAGMMQDPNFALTFETTAVKVARSGDIAYELGTYQMTSSDPRTKQPATQTGTFVSVWGKQADGSWKCVVDAPNSDAPQAAPGK